MKVERSEILRRSSLQCFICGKWSWEVSAVKDFGGTEMCLPCYVDVLEVRQARGAMGAEASRFTSSARERVHPTPESDDSPGSSPSPYRQLELFD